MDKVTFINLLSSANFITQSMLENTLYNLKIKDRSKYLYLENFNGQLEKDSDGSPYWNVILETSRLTTRRLLAKAISKELFNIGKDARVKVSALLEFKKLERKNIFLIEDSKFSPGFFNKTVLIYKNLAKNKEVKEWLDLTNS
jgi:hypothetical protein